jgi:hypothetical protein
MDYIWGLAFLMLALERSVAGRPLVAGIALGLAGAARLSLLAFALPLGLVLVHVATCEHTRRRILAFGAATTVTWGVAFSPVLLTYGLDFWHYMPWSRPLWESLWMLTIGTWGPLGTIVLACTIGAAVLAWRRGHTGQAALPGARAPLLQAAWISGAALGLGIFLRLPIEPAYAIVAIPFLLILLGSWAPRTVFMTLCLALLVAPLIPSSGFFQNPFLAEQQNRRVFDDYLDAVLDAADELPDDDVILSGYATAHLWAKDTSVSVEDSPFVRSFAESRVEGLAAEGVRIHYLERIADRTPIENRAALDSVADPLELDWPPDRSLPSPHAAGRLEFD